MKNFRTFDLAKAFYRRSRHLPLNRSLHDQLERASVSVALNLAEGRGKRTTKDQVRFFQVALGSARECQAILELADHPDEGLVKLLDRLAGSIYLLIEKANEGAADKPATDGR